MYICTYILLLQYVCMCTSYNYNVYYLQEIIMEKSHIKSQVKNHYAEYDGNPKVHGYGMKKQYLLLKTLQ